MIQSNRNMLSQDFAMALTPDDNPDRSEYRPAEARKPVPAGAGSEPDSDPGSGRAAAARLFRPSAASLNWVIAIGFLSLGYAMYLRYLVIEQSAVGLACDNGLKTWLCLSRAVVSALFNNEVFGWVGVGAAVLALIRPSLALFTIALSASAFGIVLYNAGLSGLAAALLVMCFARPASAP
jgi:hypothetical protein